VDSGGEEYLFQDSPGRLTKSFPGAGKAVALRRRIHQAAALKESGPVVLNRYGSAQLLETRSRTTATRAVTSCRGWMEGLGIEPEGAVSLLVGEGRRSARNGR
jgi:hypothetical protein